MLGTFFAAATIGDVGTGGGDGAGDGVGDAGGDTDGDADADSDAGDEGSSSEEDASSETGAGDELSDDGTGDSDPDAPVNLGDGRQVPGKIKKLFELAKKTGTEKEVKQLYFSNQRLNKAIPGGVNAAIQLARDVEKMGGIEGVREISDELGGYHADSQLFESGDARWTETGFKESPEVAIKHTVHSLNYMQEHHPENFDHIVAKYIVADLGNLPHSIYAVLKGQKDNPEAQKLAKELADYFNSRREKADKAPEKTDSAKDKELTARETKAKEAEMKGREAQARAEIKPALQNSIGSSIRAEGKARGLDLVKLSKEYPAEYFDMVSKIHAEVNRLASADERFLRNYVADLTKGDVARAAKRANQKHNDVIGDAVRTCFAKSGLFRGKKAGTGNKGNAGAGNKSNANATPQGFTRVSEQKFKAELRKLVDYDRSPAKDRMDGRYTLKDGRKIEVVY